ncbi:ABC transporter [Brevibacterium moorei]|uniref:ABC transporter n=1 Tax=Brevibacterium moorei TaxID=2968457 RepID=UPI00211CCDE7|nr:ABC transporter [Brevibacterium sp. 68QC2CO]MCQ9384816.1 ABC transporter [Brevibacterium sp. 68QC2CO]
MSVTTIATSDQQLPTALGPALRDLVARVGAARFPLAASGAEAGRELQIRLRAQLGDYLIPRAADPRAPLLVVVGGSTGAGKSTLVNSILRTEATRAGALRPTTTWPVLIHNPADADFFTGNRIFPGLKRIAGGTTAAGRPSMQLVESTEVPAGIALIDSPDIDSVASTNREVSRELLGAADLWLFVTTSARYADAAPWEVLKGASDRGTSVAVVLDRVPADANREVRHHLGGLLHAAGLGQAPLFTIPEIDLEHGLLPESAVYPVKSWLFNLATGDRARLRVINRTLLGALHTVGAQIETLADDATRQEDAHRELSAAVEGAFAGQIDELSAALRRGDAVRGEVQARWQDFIGTGQFFKGLEPSVARLRDRLTARVVGKQDTAGPLIASLQSSINQIIRLHAVEAVGRTALAWQQTPAGTALLDRNRHMAAVPASFTESAKDFTREFVGKVFAEVSQASQTRKAKARILSFGVEAVGAVVLISLVSGVDVQTPGRARVVANTAEVAEHLLDTIFGPDVVSGLLGGLRTDLEAGTGELLRSCRRPFEQALTVAEVPARQGRGLRSASARLEELL